MFLLGFEAWTFEKMAKSKWWLGFFDGWN